MAQDAATDLGAAIPAACISHPVPVDMSLLRRDGRERTERQIRRIVRSTRTELSEREGAFRILGPDTSHHRADPRLEELLEGFEPGLSIARIGSYRATRRRFDLCLEDSWTGFFVAGALRRLDPQDDLVLVHLDDHTDMMSTLLVVDGDTLIDPARATTFCPASAADWEGSIRSGCIGIGSFITALLFLDQRVHVRHLNNRQAGAREQYDVVPEPCEYPLIPGKRFAAVGKARQDSGPALGTYVGGPDARLVLQSAPPGHVIVHIDLDYFINDYNGNAGAQPGISVAEQRSGAQRKIESFFAALGSTVSRVEAWIVATSPGFCSIIHWDWLLASLDEKIREFEASRQKSGA